jgi:predicted nucleic acid-binding protein
MKIFIDSDVVISSLISQKGAAYQLLNLDTMVTKVVSAVSLKELTVVTNRLGIERVLPKFEICKIKNIEKYSEYSLDANDAHIIAGADQSNSRFLITYNLRHYKIDKIKRDFEIIIMIPGIFLQYLRLGGEMLN